ncbi:hypothetical protein Goshw_027926, partial [Gossypium schwendimanii]|nr:hypothetical protein [Gossypium schwendimanii]
SSSFLHGGSTSLYRLSKPNSSLSCQPLKSPAFLPPIRAMKSMQGKVVCATNDKTVSVEVLEKSRPISKTKTFIAVPIPSKNGKPRNEETGELGIPLESNQP